MTTGSVATHCGEIDMIFEATGVAHLEVDRCEAPGRDGVIEGDLVCGSGGQRNRSVRIKAG